MAKSRRGTGLGPVWLKCFRGVAGAPQIYELVNHFASPPPPHFGWRTPRKLNATAARALHASPRNVVKLLDRRFFARSVHAVAPDLIGATLLVRGTGGIIVEVEAYHHTEAAAHSYRGPTPRNAVMFGPPGYAYVYRSYGIHWCVNFVCEPEGSASAVLIRALQPVAGIATMRRRRGLKDERLLCSGPGRLCEALGITDDANGLALEPPWFALQARRSVPAIAIGSRIGITKAVELPWRYGLKGSRFLSKPFPRS
jgi:DNA-3-methyladenine glycosylase